MPPVFPHPALTGYVLAGGASSRMGQDKALLKVDGKTLLEIAVAKLREICADVAILSGGASSPERLAALKQSARAVPETGTYLGPVAGIAAALADAAAPWLMVLAVDQPFLPAALLREWSCSALASGEPASCMVLGETLQPIPLLVQSRLALPVARCLDAGERKITAVLDSVLAGEQGKTLHRFVVEETGLSRGWFRNLNSPGDLS